MKAKAENHTTLQFETILLIAAAFRVLLLIYGSFQDAYLNVKYTDIDYLVFTDAARFIHQGASPYLRATYRYTPLLALTVLPNVYFFEFGKLVFVLADLTAGWLIYRIVQQRKNAALLSAVWLLNPMVANISTRGSAESVLACLVLATLERIHSRSMEQAAVIFGFAVHFKLYPVIYALPIWLWIDAGSSTFFTRPRIKFGVISFSVFAALNAAMFYCFGADFIQETFTYHVTRQDHRHNFSLWFYYLYLAGNPSLIARIGAFIPQLFLVSLAGWRYRNDLGMAMFMQTLIFVTFNKVCTSQYFMWYICLVPVVASNIKMTWQRLAVLVLAWISAQGIWLRFAYELEFQGQNMFFQVFLSSVLFFLVNCWCIYQLAVNYQTA